MTPNRPTSFKPNKSKSTSPLTSTNSYLLTSWGQHVGLRIWQPGPSSLNGRFIGSRTSSIDLVFRNVSRLRKLPRGNWSLNWQTAKICHWISTFSKVSSNASTISCRPTALTANPFKGGTKESTRWSITTGSAIKSWKSSKKRLLLLMLIMSILTLNAVTFVELTWAAKKSRSTTCLSRMIWIPTATTIGFSTVSETEAKGSEGLWLLIWSKRAISSTKEWRFLSFQQGKKGTSVISRYESRTWFKAGTKITYGSTNFIRNNHAKDLYYSLSFEYEF